MRVVLHVLGTLCTVVGAIVLYSVAMVGLWMALVRVIRRLGGRPQPIPDGAAPATGRDRRARTWEELPAWLHRDRPWAVAVLLLGGPPIRERTAEFVDFPARRIDWPGLLTASGAWPADQRLLVLTAYELAFDTAGEVERSLSEQVTLTDVVQLLDDDGVDRVRMAMDVRRGRVAVDEVLIKLRS